MKKRFIVFMFFVFFVATNSIFAITPSGITSKENKLTIYPQGDNTCSDSEGTSHTVYKEFGGVYLARVKEENLVENENHESDKIYKTKEAAYEKCQTFIKDNYISGTEETYICGDVVPKTAYACNVKEISAEISGNVTENTKDKANDYLHYYDEMYSLEEDCLIACDSTCSLETGYAYQYYRSYSSEIVEEDKIINIQGKVFETNEGDYAFCIQPAELFSCYSDGSSNYCQYTDFNLSNCKGGYDEDYRCGLAYILLKAEDEYNLGTIDGYASADVALRMWAAYKGNLKGTDTIGVPTNEESFNSKTMFFSITAKRVQDDSNYLAYGIKCAKSSKNSGVMCDNGFTVYMNSLKLYKEALEAETLDAKGGKVPKLLTPTIDSTTSQIITTNPTEEACNIGENDCTVVISLYDAEGNKVETGSTYCDKNLCYSKIEGKRLCSSSGSSNYSTEITVKNFEVGGSVREYRHCTKPDERQIMMVIDATGKETTDKVYQKAFATKVACECSDSNSLSVRTDSKKMCANYDSFNTSKNDYITGNPGYEVGYVKDPSMAEILNTCTGKNYYRVEDYETYSDTCKIYCRKEAEFYLPNKTKVYSGMQFQYKIESSLKSGLKVNQHLTSIVYQKRQCVSEIFYDKKNDDGETWKERFERAEKEVARTWNEWKIWEARLYWMAVAEETKEIEPTEIIYSRNCTAGCETYKNSPARSTPLVCSLKETLSSYYADKLGPNKEPYKACIEANKISADAGPYNDICFPLCTSIFVWKAEKANHFEYPSGASTIIDYAELRDGSHGQSGRYCQLGLSGCQYSLSYTNKRIVYVRNNRGKLVPREETDGPYSLNGTEIPNNTRILNEWGSVSYDEAKKDLLLGGQTVINSRLKNIYSSEDRFLNSLTVNCSEDAIVHSTLGTCEEGKDGEYELVVQTEIQKKNAYASAQKIVQNLLTALQSCNMYGSGLEGESDIKNYTLTKNPPGQGGSGSNSDGSTPGGSFNDDNAVQATEGFVAKPSNSSLELIEYNPSSLFSNSNEEYGVKGMATTANSKSIKRKILKDAACVDDTCADLVVEYQDTVFGKSLEYNKVTGIISTDQLFNAYCEGAECYRNAHSEDEEDGWARESSTEIVNLIVCNNVPEVPVEKECKIVPTPVPDNDYVSFKVTTEVDFYRNKYYYTKAFTGEVVEAKENTKMSSKQYSALGKNVYPVGNDKINGATGNHSINYTFTNLGSGKFSINKYEYECSYEIYNNSTGYDCVVKYDENGDPIPSECSNFCFYVEDTVPDLSCIKWSDELSGDKNYGFVFRNVDLSDLFPSGREYGTNWSKATEIIEDIQNSAENIYTDEHLVLSVTLNPDSIKKIREYNRYKNTNAGGYLDNSLVTCSLELSIDGINDRFTNCRSSFIDEIASGSGVLGVKTNKIIRSGSDRK